MSLKPKKLRRRIRQAPISLQASNYNVSSTTENSKETFDARWTMEIDEINEQARESSLSDRHHNKKS